MDGGDAGKVGRDELRHPGADDKRPDQEAADGQDKQEIAEHRVKGEPVDPFRKGALLVAVAMDLHNLCHYLLCCMVTLTAQHCTSCFPVDLFQFPGNCLCSRSNIRCLLFCLPHGIRIAFQQLDSGPPGGVASRTGGQQLHELLDAIFHFLPIGNSVRFRAVMHSPDNRVRELGDPLALDRNGRDDRDTQQFREFVYIDTDPFLRRKVCLVKGKDHRAFEFRKLKREKEVPFKCGRIENVHDHVRVVVGDELAGDLLLSREGIDGVDAREIDHPDPLAPVLEETFCPLNGLSRPVADLLVNAGELVEGHTLADIGISGKGNHVFTFVIRSS